MDLHAPLFGDPEIDATFSATASLEAMLAFEVALAEAHAAVGLVPPSTADAVRQAARADRYDLDLLAADAARAGNVAIPLVAALTRETARIDPAAARAVHLGATSQDVIDTALVLQLRAALPAVANRLTRAADAAARHAGAHRRTPMAGRTWLQQATPVTFGLKAAGWLEAIARGRQRIDQRGATALVLQFGGASGTLAALGGSADAVADALAARLGLPRPSMPWHAHRDRLAALACALGVVTGTLGKVARDIALLSQTEVGEVSEAPAPGRGGSSTMPHKQNPVSSAVALAASVRAPGLVASMLAAMPQEHERGLGGWQAEWALLPELVRVTGGAARAMADALEGLVVDASRMAANLRSTGGFAQTEAVVVALVPHLGRADAHARVEAACALAVRERRALEAILESDPVVTDALGRGAVAHLLAPGEYLGQAEATVDRVLAAWRAEAAADA